MQTACQHTKSPVRLTFFLLLIPLLTACSLADPLLRETHRADSSHYVAAESASSMTPTPAEPTPLPLSDAETSIAIVPASADLSKIVNPDSQIYIQVGAFDSEQNANRYREELAKLLSYPVTVYRDDLAEKVLFKVQLGPFKDLQSADAAERKLRQQTTVESLSYIRR